MEQMPVQDNIDKNRIKEMFDHTLSQHIERLLGTKYGIESLVMGLATIPSLILLSERETEIESFPYRPPPRFTDATIIAELAENSLEPGNEAKEAIRDLIEKGYIEVADDGRFFAGKPTISMSKLLERIFPNMPGINFIAYLGQLMDEVISGRRPLESAARQFDQMLHMQGVPLKRGETLPAASGISDPSGELENLPEDKASRIDPPSVVHTGKIHPGDIYSHLQTTHANSAVDVSQSQTHPPTAPEDPGQFEINCLKMKDLSSQRELSKTVHLDVEEMHEETPKGGSEDTSGVNSAEKSGATQIENDSEIPEEKIEPEVNQKRLPKPIDDDFVEGRIAAFQEELGMICPMCKKARIRLEGTAKGKPFYRCSHYGCAFISWGKPHYLPCPQCGNHFLIEIVDGAGNTILKCPRSTCRYWQEAVHEGMALHPEEPVSSSQEVENPPSVSKRPRRRVVRRRVVRRKR